MIFLHVIQGLIYVLNWCNTFQVDSHKIVAVSSSLGFKLSVYLVTELEISDYKASDKCNNHFLPTFIEFNFMMWEIRLVSSKYFLKRQRP